MLTTHNFENLITNKSVDPYSPFFKTLCIYKISFLDLPARMKWEQIHIQALKDVINQVDRGKFALLLKEPTHVQVQTFIVPAPHPPPQSQFSKRFIKV